MRTNFIMRLSLVSFLALALVLFAISSEVAELDGGVDSSVVSEENDEGGRRHEAHGGLSPFEQLFGPTLYQWFTNLSQFNPKLSQFNPELQPQTPGCQAVPSRPRPNPRNSS